MIFTPKFRAPSLTTQLVICPVPLHYDSYKGCNVGGCIYCFARDLVQFHWRNRSRCKFTDIEGNRPDLLGRWLKKTFDNLCINNPVSIALKKRIPIKIGAVSDPCPVQEKEYHITRDSLVEFARYNYPVQIQTKNPKILWELLNE